MANQSTPLLVQQLVCKQFRCFSHVEIDLNSPLVLCEDANGSGKTSLLEALYYAAHLRSFRTHVPREMVHFGKENFFVKLFISEHAQEESIHHELSVGFSSGKRLVRINKQLVTSHKDLIQHYRVMSVTEDDLALIKGSPEFRRDFIDMALALYHTDYLALVRTFKQTLQQRNALLSHAINNDTSFYLVLSRKLAELSYAIQTARKNLLVNFSEYITSMLGIYFEQYHIEFTYVPRFLPPQDHFESPANCKRLLDSEMRMGRTLWGAHLDDIAITLNDKQSRHFSSRGQQKLMVILMKMAHLHELSKRYGSAIVLLDDFATDLDEKAAQKLVELLFQGKNQLIFTVPSNSSAFSRSLREYGAKTVSVAR